MKKPFATCRFLSLSRNMLKLLMHHIQTPSFPHTHFPRKMGKLFFLLYKSVLFTVHMYTLRQSKIACCQFYSHTIGIGKFIHMMHKCVMCWKCLVYLETSPLGNAHTHTLKSETIAAVDGIFNDVNSSTMCVQVVFMWCAVCVCAFLLQPWSSVVVVVINVVIGIHVCGLEPPGREFLLTFSIKCINADICTYSVYSHFINIIRR